MIAALRYTRFALLADIALMVILAIALAGASRLGFDIQPWKWTTVLYGGVLMALAVLLSVSAITLQIIVGFHRRSEAN